jgi:hypothetical protein
LHPATCDYWLIREPSMRLPSIYYTYSKGADIRDSILFAFLSSMHEAICCDENLDADYMAATHSLASEIQLTTLHHIHSSWNALDYALYSPSAIPKSPKHNTARVKDRCLRPHTHPSIRPKIVQKSMDDPAKYAQEAWKSLTESKGLWISYDLVPQGADIGSQVP